MVQARIKNELSEEEVRELIHKNLVVSVNLFSSLEQALQEICDISYPLNAAKPRAPGL